MINIKENIKNIEEFNLLYDAVGWGAYDEKIAQKALDLGASKHREKFYEKFGFVKRIDADLGYGMIYKE